MDVEYGKREDQPRQHDQIGAQDQRQSSEVPERGVIACVGQPVTRLTVPSRVTLIVCSQEFLGSLMVVGMSLMNPIAATMMPAHSDSNADQRQ